jgi:hypothetical protein
MYEQTGNRGASSGHVPWNKGRLTGQKRPFTLKQIWEIRIRLQIADRTRDLALFNLGIDSKLRGCDLVRLHVSDITHGDQILSRAKVIQKKTGRPVSFEVTPETRGALLRWIAKAGVSAGDFLFFSRIDRDRHLTTRQYARLVHEWVDMIGADPSEYGTHSLRRSKATLIYRQTKNLRAVFSSCSGTQSSNLRCAILGWRWTTRLRLRRILRSKATGREQLLGDSLLSVPAPECDANLGWGETAHQGHSPSAKTSPPQRTAWIGWRLSIPDNSLVRQGPFGYRLPR